MDIGLMISTERTKNNMSKHELSKKVGCTVRAIEYWENGERNINIYYLDKVLKALGLTMKIGIDGEFDSYFL